MMYLKHTKIYIFSIYKNGILQSILVYFYKSFILSNLFIKIPFNIFRETLYYTIYICLICWNSYFFEYSLKESNKIFTIFSCLFCCSFESNSCHIQEIYNRVSSFLS